MSIYDLEAKRMLTETEARIAQLNTDYGTDHYCACLYHSAQWDDLVDAGWITAFVQDAWPRKRSIAHMIKLS
jgi:hypothetical protein